MCLGIILAGCNSPPAPVYSRKPPPDQRIHHHIVSKGETLYAIAWRYELSLASLSAANGLRPPYALVVGQRLSLDSKPVQKPARAKRRVASTRHKQASRPVYQAKAHKVERSVKGGASKQATGRQGKQTSFKAEGTWRWQWPVKGKVSRHYDTNRVFKGLNIQSSAGKIVKAAAPGVVVFAGQGLRGYGRLLIVRHSDAYLSAYAHNRKMFVTEGQRIRAGQKLSEVGGDPENSGRLYFEIRKEGKPVDPMRLLPRL